MQGLARHMGRGAARFTGWLIGLVLILAVLMQVGFWIFTGWLATSSGQGWANRMASNAMQASGYRVEARGIHVYGLGALRLDRLTVADAAGVFISADDIRLRAGLIEAVMARRLPVSLTIDRLALDRKPVVKATAPAKKYDGQLMKPFVLKRPFIHEIALQPLMIHTLTLGAPVMGQALALTPRITADLSLGTNSVALTLDGQTGADDKMAAWLPRTIHLKTSVRTDKAVLDLAALDIKAQAVVLAASGTAGLDRGPLALNGSVQANDLGGFSQKKFNGSAAAQFALSGTTLDPAIDAKGAVQSPELQARDVTSVQFVARATSLLTGTQGIFDVVTSYKNRPASLDMQYKLDGQVLSIPVLKLAAPDIAADGQFTVNIHDRLGQGQLTASAVLDSYRDLIGAPVSGKIKASVSLDVKNGRQAVGATANVADVSFQTIRLKAASVTASLADAKNPWPKTADIRLNGLRVNNLAIDNFTAGLKQSTPDRYAMTVASAGRLRRPFTLKGTADISGHNVNDAAVNAIELTFKTGKGSAVLSGAVLPDRLNLAIKLQSLPLSAAPVTLPDSLAGMSVSGAASAQGMLAAPLVKTNLSFSPVQVKQGVPRVTINLAALYGNGQASAAMTGKGSGIDVLKADARLPMVLSLRPFKFAMDKSASLKGGFLAKLNLGVLARALLPPDFDLSGRLDAQGSLGGTLAKPAPAGNGTFSGGRFVMQSANVKLDAIDLRAGFKNGGVTLASLSAKGAEGGTLAAHGTLDLARRNAASFVLQLRDFNPFMSTSQVHGAVSADLTLKGAGNAYAAGGVINPGQVDVTIPERFSNAIPQLNIVDPRAAKAQNSNLLKSIVLKIAVHAPNRIFVRGWGLDAEFGGDLSVDGNLAAPIVNGNLASLRGRYEEFSKRFDLKRANLRFQGAVPPSPYLDIEAQTTADSFTAIIDLTGRAADPKIALSSTPAMPQDQVLSHLLFGKDMSNISPFQAIQLASTIQRFSGHGGGPGLLDTLRSRTGLDDIEVNNSASGDTTVGAGKYVTDKVYVQVEGGNAKNSGAANVQYQLTPHLTINSKVSQDAQAGGGVAWSWDY